jgi:nitrate/nitrite-specific signal transduction histidine kinase
VEVNLKKENNILQVIIEDDGIGRTKAAAIKSKNSTSNKSYGMQITNMRLKQLNSSNNVETSDLKDAAGNAAGTKIVLTIHLSNEV